MNSSSTAEEGSDWVTSRNSSNIVIPIGLVGLYRECLDIYILGDDTIEDDEVIEFGVVPISERDNVSFANGGDSLRITIQDNDGEKCQGLNS